MLCVTHVCLLTVPGSKNAGVAEGAHVVMTCGLVGKYGNIWKKLKHFYIEIFEENTTNYIEISGKQQII